MVPLRQSLGALALLAGALPAGAQSGPAIRDTVLANGLQVVVVENRAVPLASVAVVVRNGAFTQRDDGQGVAHLFEHMLFEAYRGVQDRPFWAEASLLEASYNGFTASETVAYYLTLPSRRTEKGLALLARLMRPNAFVKATLDKERQVVLDELKRRVAEPDNLLGLAVEQRLWGAGFPRKNIGGITPDLMMATPKRLTELYRRYYVPNNAALVVTGDVSAARVFAVAAEEFGKWKAGADPFDGNPSIAPPALDRPMGVVIPHAAARDITVLVSTQGPSAVSERAESFALQLLASVVNDEASRLQERLVDGGLFDWVSLSYEPLAMGGELSVRGRTSSDRLPRALPALKEELAALTTAGYVSPAELQAAKNRFAVSRALQAERITSLGLALARQWSVAGLEYYRDTPSAVQGVEAEMLRRVATEYLVARPRVIGILTPESNAEQDGARHEQLLAQFLTT
ncbi:MAG TPA: pitrilysin family protein, partial [Gemmatimonadaceae bacterium]|nr:pitrilysin family protein [Gemmatimonadaceae bacterium]